MAAAALGLGDAAHVDLSERPQAHTDSAVGLLFEDARDLGLGGAAQDVDEALDLLDRDLMLREVALGHRGPDEASLGDEVRAVQLVAEELQIREPVLLEQRATQARDGDVVLHELARHAEDGGRRGVVLEPAGVAHERGVQAHGGVAVERQAEHANEPVHERPTGCRVRVDHIDRAVPVVRDVVVDDDQLGRGLGRLLEVAEPAERAAVERDHDRGLAREIVRRREPVETRKLAVMRRDDERGWERRYAVRPGAAQDVEEAEHRAQGVAVGTDVARQGDVGSVANRAYGAIECLVDFRPAGLRHCSSCRWSSRMMSSTRWPVVIAGSSRNDSRGRYLSRTW